MRADRIGQMLCGMGAHDAYFTLGLLGYDLKCRRCGRCRYPTGWHRYRGAYPGQEADVALIQDNYRREGMGIYAETSS